MAIFPSTVGKDDLLFLW